MSTSESEWDLEAAEYVLGTQSEENTRVFDTLYKVDDDWKRRVHFWQTRLDPMHTSTPSVQPPRRVLAKVLSRIEGVPSEALIESEIIESELIESELIDSEFIQSDFIESKLIESEIIDSDRIESDFIEADRSKLDFIEAERGELDFIEAERIELDLNADASQTVSLDKTLADNPSQNNPDRYPEPSISNTLEPWKERARYWKLTSLVAAVAIAGILLVGPDYLARQWQTDNATRTVAVLQSDTNAPLWLITHTPERSILVSVVGEPQSSVEQSHQLWMVLPEGGGVQSVGLIPSTTGQTATLELPLSLNEAEEFAVSLEQSDGVAGVEHGPMVTRTFIIQNPGKPDA